MSEGMEEEVGTRGGRREDEKAVREERKKVF